MSVSPRSPTTTAVGAENRLFRVVTLTTPTGRSRPHELRPVDQTPIRPEQIPNLALCIVPFGEMEGFVPEFRTSHRKGSKWAAEVFHECADSAKGNRLASARKFMNGVVNHLSEKIR